MIKETTFRRITKAMETTVTTVLFGLLALLFYAIISSTIESGKQWDKAMEERAIEKAAQAEAHLEVNSFLEENNQPTNQTKTQ